MHQTTVRFSEDVWQELETEAAALGISAAQYIREATVARMAYVAGLRGDPERARVLRLVGANDEEIGPELASAIRAEDRRMATRES